MNRQIAKSLCFLLHENTKHTAVRSNQQVEKVLEKVVHPILKEFQAILEILDMVQGLLHWQH